MIISRQVENISDNMPTTMSRTGFKDRGDVVRGWNRVRRLNVKSNIYSPFINWSISLPLLSNGVEGKRGILLLRDQHERVYCPITDPKGLGDSCLFLHVNLTQLQLLYWVKFIWHIPTTSVILNSRFLIYQSFILWSVFIRGVGIIPPY